jgi:Protein of unknown function (DUF1236)
MMSGFVVAAVLALAVLAWPFLTNNKLGTPSGGADPSMSPDTTVSRGAPAQRAAESTLGKNEPAGLEDSSGGRARDVKESSHPLQLDTQQLQRIKDIVSQEQAPRLQKAEFEMMIGTAIPRQVQLADIPPDVTQVLNGYWGDQYVLVQDKMVVVDQHSRRVVAIVPSVG